MVSFLYNFLMAPTGPSKKQCVSETVGFGSKQFLLGHIERLTQNTLYLHRYKQFFVGLHGDQPKNNIKPKLMVSFLYNFLMAPTGRLLRLVIEKIIQQIVRVVILNFSINHNNTLIHLAQNIIWGCRTNFDEPLFQKVFADFFNRGIFQHERFVGDFVSNGAIRQKHPNRGSKLIFAKMMRSTNQFVWFGFGHFKIGVILLTGRAFIESGANALDGSVKLFTGF